MLIQKLQLLKIPDTLEAALEYVGTERWICWYCDTSIESLIIEDINSSYFGNRKAWLLFCSYMNNNPYVEFKGSAYEHFESLMSSQYPYKEAHEAETQVTGNLSLSNDETAYLFDRQARELYSGSATDIQTLIKQPNSLAMWAELQGESYNETKLEEELSEPLSTIDEWVLTKSLVILVAVWLAFAMIPPVPWALTINIPQSISRFLFLPPFTSLEAEKVSAEVDRLLWQHQAAELSNRPRPLRVIKKQKSECKSLDK